jgi:hypothetical protein
VLDVLPAAAFVGAVVWVLAALGVVLGVGLSWSHLRRALSGQADVDGVDE